MTRSTSGTAPRYLYLARHGEASPDESELTDNGRRQAVLLGERLRGSALSAIHHGPLPRTEQTARLICDQLDDVPAQQSELAGDYVPYLAQRAELPPESADALLDRLAQFPAEECDNGPELARKALAQFTGPVDGDEPRHELIVTHNFLIGWLIRDALDAPKWRWMGLNHANAALSIIRYAPGRPASVLFYNDMGHLPPELRWTGFPPELRG
ncbi:histidine phosphatase family protein [Streptomyces gilvosporeus]|uniref:Histidine phosphatase family protein n=1 Tax=Streptomyces gilvosporeus TaxID=553510 RepID=A0A1V0TJJ6_9ACTN|nr:histidine phosphatase family protein [Streptomyces gilvosporeus]ARF53105.1 histidine phosphatase family protein [Streptomyces gilvosporeus]